MSSLLGCEEHRLKTLRLAGHAKDIPAVLVPGPISNLGVIIWNRITTKTQACGLGPATLKLHLFRPTVTNSQWWARSPL